MEFSQVHVSSILERNFGEGFRKMWNLIKYEDTNKPAVFFGLYSNIDREKLLKHNGVSIVIWGGADLKKTSIELVKKLTDLNKCFTFAYPGEFSKVLSNNKIKHKKIVIPLKDYSNFLDFPLGDKIYVYRGINGNREDYFKWKEVVQPLIEYFGKDRIIYADTIKIQELMENYYKKCFVYVKPTTLGGCTTMFELGCMGRRTIGIGHTGLHNFTEYKSINNLIKLIEEEMKYIYAFISILYIHILWYIYIYYWYTRYLDIHIYI